MSAMDDQRQLYQELHEKHPGRVQALGYGSTRAQLKRFEAACEVMDLKGLSVLDVGCGYGDLAPFVVAKRVKSYTGIDIVPEFLAEAVMWRAQLRDEGERIAFMEWDVESLARRDIATGGETGLGEFDVVMALGTAGFGDGAFFEMLLRCCFCLAKKAAVVSCPTVFSPGSRRVPGRDREVFFLHPQEMAERASEVTKRTGHRFVLRHDYLPSDQMVYLYR